MDILGRNLLLVVDKNSGLQMERLFVSTDPRRYLFPFVFSLDYVGLICDNAFVKKMGDKVESKYFGTGFTGSFGRLSFWLLVLGLEAFGQYFGLVFTLYWLVFGWILVNKNTNTKNIKIWMIFGVVIMFVSVFLTRKLVFILETHDQDTILVSRLSLTVVATALIIFKVLLGNENKKLEKYKNILSLSQYSFGICLVHPLWLRIFEHLDFVNQLMAINYWLWFAGLYVAVLIMSFWTAWAFKKVPGLKWLV